MFIYRRTLLALLIIAVLLISACKQEEVVKKEPKVIDPSKPDIVMIGSEIEGIYLARAARDEGLSVVILDPRELPGGQLIQGEMLYLDEPFADNRDSLLQGRVKELFDLYKKGDIRKKSEFEPYFNALLEGIPLESGIQINNIELATGTDANDRRINSISYRTKDGQERTVTAKYWVENTDYAAIVSKLGLKRIPGVETVFGGDKDHMAASIMMKFRNVDWDKFQKETNKFSSKELEEKYGGLTTVTDKFTWGFGNVGSRYKATTKEVFLRGLNTINQRDGDVLINALLVYGVDPADPASINKALELGKQETDRILPHLRKELPGWENAESNGYPNYLYIRDYDRYETEYILQATDLMSGLMHKDNVSIAGYPIDLQGTVNYQWGHQQGKPDKYGMPLRSFIPKGYSNVIVAGKNVGASAIAYGSARIQPNTAQAAEVIGIMLARTNAERNLMKLSEKELKELQAYIKKTAGITLTGVTGANKIEKLTEEQRNQLNLKMFEIPK
ncbi:MAG: FAD-dependent oxidoreductase [Paenibacillus sp.]|nr:FAD-dependent oxidoreductase [Paenibacillus sp.]